MPSWTTRALAIVMLASVVLIGGAACIGLGNTGTLKSTVENGGATAIQATFTLDRGELKMNGGASSLMQGEFITNNQYDPAIAYVVHGQEGTLTLTQAAEQTGFGFAPIENNWSVLMNNEIPLNVLVDSGGAHAVLNLDTLTVTKFVLNSDSGDATVSLDGVQNKLTNIGLSSTSGDVHLKMNGQYTQSRSIVASSTSGNITADLSGDSSASVNGSFKSTSGTINIVVPGNVGVEIETSTSGTIDATGLIAKGQGMYVNSAYGVSKITMLLSVHSTSGRIKLREAD